jgi:hypothetical protein
MPDKIERDKKLQKEYKRCYQIKQNRDLIQVLILLKQMKGV